MSVPLSDEVKNQLVGATIADITFNDIGGQCTISLSDGRRLMISFGNVPSCYVNNKPIGQYPALSGRLDGIIIFRG